MENYNTSKLGYKSLVLTQDFKVKPVYRLIDGKHATTTQLSTETDIVIRRYKHTNDLVIENAGFLNKQEVLDKLPKNVYEWLLSNDAFKLIKGEWWDGTLEGTLNYQRYSRRILSLLRGLNRPDIYERIMKSKQIRSTEIPSWVKAKPFPKVLDGNPDADTYYFVMYPNTGLEVYEFNGEECIDMDDGKAISFDSINSKDLQIHNIIQVEISKTKVVKISLYAKVIDQ